MTITTEMDDEAVVDDAQAQADFDAGAEMETPRPKTVAETETQPQEAKPEPKPEPAPKKPEYVQVTREQYERWEAAAKKTDTHEQQFSKAFGSLGDMQKIVRSLQSQTPRGAAVKIPPNAFEAMEKDFPEVAQHMRTALEATLKGLEGTGGAGAEIDPALFEKKIEARVLQMETEALEDQYPDWKQIVGAVDTRKEEKPDPNNAFRKWLATKDEVYQKRVNGTNSAAIIARAIRLFKSETTPKPKVAAPDPKVQQRANRIQDAVRPKSDGGQPPVNNGEDEFEAGYRTG